MSGYASSAWASMRPTSTTPSTFSSASYGLGFGVARHAGPAGVQHDRELSFDPIAERNRAHRRPGRWPRRCRGRDGDYSRDRRTMGSSCSDRGRSEIRNEGGDRAQHCHPWPPSTFVERGRAMKPARIERERVCQDEASCAPKVQEVRSGNINVIRRKDLNRLFVHRYGLTLPDDQAGCEDAALMLAHIAAGADPDVRMDHFLDIRCPWMPAADRDRAKAIAAMSRPTWTADELAAMVGLTMAERTRLNITTIGAIDCDKAAREAIRRSKQKARQREYRQAARERPKPPPAPSARAFALYRALPSIGWRATKHICDDLADAPEFAGLSSIRSAVHLAIRNAEQRGMVKTRQEIGQGGMPTKLVARTR